MHRDHPVHDYAAVIGGAQFIDVREPSEVAEGTLPGTVNIPLATLPGMWERTLTLSSTGKTFSMTGWKIGYAIGPAPMVGGRADARSIQGVLSHVGVLTFVIDLEKIEKLADALVDAMDEEAGEVS